MTKAALKQCNMTEEHQNKENIVERSRVNNLQFFSILPLHYLSPPPFFCSMISSHKSIVVVCSFTCFSLILPVLPLCLIHSLSPVCVSYMLFWPHGACNCHFPFARSLSRSLTYLLLHSPGKGAVHVLMTGLFICCTILYTYRRLLHLPFSAHFLFSFRFPPSTFFSQKIDTVTL